MDFRTAAAFLFAVTGCAGHLEQTQPDEAPRERIAASSASSTPAKRSAPAIVQAASEMRLNPELYVVLIGPDAVPARKAILREGHGQIVSDRVRVAPHGPPPGSTARPRVAFYFYVPDGRSLEERFPELHRPDSDR